MGELHKKIINPNGIFNRILNMTQASLLFSASVRLMTGQKRPRRPLPPAGPYPPQGGQYISQAVS